MSKKEQISCTCSAYPYKHRWKGGKCTGWQAVEKVWEEENDACRDCSLCTYFKGDRETPDEFECSLLEKLYNGAKPEDCPGLDRVVEGL